jgi:hypothetical protein
LGTESDSEGSDDSSKDEDYKSSGNRMKHFKKILQQISPLPKLSADSRPAVSRRSHGRVQKATALSSNPYKRTLECSKDKGKKRMQMKIQLSQMQMMWTPVGFASCVARAVRTA